MKASSLRLANEPMALHWYRKLSPKWQLLLACLLAAPLGRYAAMVVGWASGYYSGASFRIFLPNVFLGVLFVVIVVPIASAGTMSGKYFALRSGVWSLIIAAVLSFMVLGLDMSTGLWPYKWLYDSVLISLGCFASAFIGQALQRALSTAAVC